MRKRTLKNLLSFLLVLVLTVCTVTALSMVTRAQTDPSLPAVEEVVPAAELSAAVPHTWAYSPWLCAGGFVLMLVIVAGGLWIYHRGKVQGKGNPRGHRSYTPRADMAFSGSHPGRNRV